MKTVITTVCEACGKAEANCHFAGTFEGKKSSKLVCWNCYQELVALDRAYNQTHCRYCGSQPCVQDCDFELYVKSDCKSLFMCKRCASKYELFFAGLADYFPQDFPNSTVISEWRVRLDVERLMWDWIAKEPHTLACGA